MPIMKATLQQWGSEGFLSQSLAHKPNFLWNGAGLLSPPGQDGPAPEHWWEAMKLLALVLSSLLLLSLGNPQGSVEEVYET
jgi:hypothetical protein